MELDISLLNTQQYKVLIKGKVEQFREKSSALHNTCCSYWKGAFWSPSTTVVNFTYYSYIYIYVRVCVISKRIVCQ